MPTNYPAEPITIISQKFDGTGRKTWPAFVQQQAGNLIVCEAVFFSPVQHEHLGYVPAGTKSLEYYWLDRWYNVFCFLEKSGAVRNYYCNIALPPRLESGVLTFTDLDLDVLVSPDGTWQVLDEEEYAANAKRFNYDAELLRNISFALQGLLELVTQQLYPFMKFT
jgi:uncharacterized protein